MIIDAQAQTGPRLTDHHLAIYPADSIDHLLQEYRAQGIHGALVHAASTALSEVTPDYIEANKSVVSQVEAIPNSYSAIRINPNARGQHDSYVERTLALGQAKAMVFAPIEDGYTIDDSRLRPYLEQAREHRLLVIILMGNFHHRDVMPLRLKNWIGDFPDVPVLLTQVGYRVQSDAVMIASEHDNVYLGTSDSTMLFLLNTVGKKLSAERFMFTSNFPFSIPALEIMKINKLPITDDDKDKILHRNLIEALRLEGKNE